MGPRFLEHGLCACFSHGAYSSTRDVISREAWGDLANVLASPELPLRVAAKVAVPQWKDQTQRCVNQCAIKGGSRKEVSWLASS